MKAHQRIIREDASRERDLFGAWWENIDRSFSSADVREIGVEDASSIILKYEWLGTMPRIIKACFGLFFSGNLAGALVFAEKPGGNLDSDKTSIVPHDAWYLARGACVHWAHEHSASWFISKVCRDFLAKPNCCVLAYSDPAAGEIGTIYQALGWKYLGPSRGGPTAVMVDGELMSLRSFRRRMGDGYGQSMNDVRNAFPGSKVVPVGRKNRYVGIYGTRKYKKEMDKLFSRFILPYPKRG